jgi:hypothetical protein
MKTIMLIIHLLNGDVAKIPIVLAIGEWCSDKIDEHTKFIENPNYYEGSGKVWTHRYYKDKIVLTHYCLSMDGKYYINYNNGKE